MMIDDDNDDEQKKKENKKKSCDFPNCKKDADLQLNELDPITRLTTKSYYRCMKHIKGKIDVKWELIEGRML